MKIVQASISEHNDDGWNKKAKAGDQTGKEVNIRNWYPYNWDGILRCSDSEIANRASEIAVKLSQSNLVGYDQSERNTLYKALKDNDWDVDKYIKSGKCAETDCSAFIYAIYCCLIPSLRSNSNAPTVPQLKTRFVKCGFKWSTAKKYRDTDNNLKAGDIIVNNSAHAIMAINMKNKKATIKASKSASKYDKAIAGTYKTTDALNLRDGAGTGYKILTCMPNKTKVFNYGYYSYKGNTKWYYVKVVIDNITYIGFCSSKYLRKV